MKKIFTFAAAILASAAMMAADYTPTAVYTVCDDATLGAQWKSLNQNANFFEVGDTIVMSPFVLYQSGAADWQEWTGNVGGGSTSKTWDAMGCFKGSTAMFSSNAKAATVNSSRTYYYNVTNCTAFLIYAKSESGKGDRVISFGAYEIVEGVVATEASASANYDANVNGIAKIEGLDKAKTYQIKLTSNHSSNSTLYEIAFVGVPSKEPALKVDPAEVTLAVTASKAQDEAKVKFSGKNLTAGTYNLTIPNLAGLTVAPTSVTVGEDGKLDAEVTISYTSAVDVAAASVNITLTVGELSKTVAVNYSAALAKKYINGSANIEQLVLDNGKGYDIKAKFDALNIEYNNIDALDSLNDSKDYRNYPYLGLKLKKADATLGCWLPAGHSIAVKFGSVGADFKVIANGVEQTLTAADYANNTVESNKVLALNNTAVDTYLQIVCNSTKTLVVKQIMFDEAVATVVLPDSPTTAIENTDAAVKAVKVVRNGQMFIQKNGVLYNMQGAVVK